MAKPFTDIQTDAEYLRAVGLGYPELHMAKVHINDDNPANKWYNLADVLRVLGPEMDRRGWNFSKFEYKGQEHCEITKYNGRNGNVLGYSARGEYIFALLEAFYNAHAQGETG